MTTLGDTMRAHKNIGPGFDTLRLGLSVAILCWHSVVVCYGPRVEEQIWRSVGGGLLSALLPIFFALSGFLVIGSAARNPDLKRFIALRGLRIVPALAAEICISAILLGSLLTTLPLGVYFSDPLFAQYFGSLFGRISTVLPGVFETNPVRTVNLSLWTIAPELLCYVYMCFVLLLRVQTSGAWVTAITVAMVTLSLIADQHTFAEQGVLNTRMLVISFCFGNLVYLWRDRLPFSPLALAVAFVIGVAGLHIVGFVYFSLLCLAYFIACIGFLPIPRIGFLSHGDYSYGIYLYAFPIQQTVAYLLPGARDWWLNIALSLPLTVLVAMASWHTVEKPALTFRALIKPSEAVRPRQAAGTAMLCIGLCAYATYLLARANIADSGAYGFRGLRLFEIGVPAGLMLTALLLVVDRANRRRSFGEPVADLQISTPTGQVGSPQVETGREVQVVRKT